MSFKLNLPPPEDLNLPEIEPVEPVDPEEFKKNISKLSSEKLCEITASFRYLGIMKVEAISSMEELAWRRLNGEVFDYETRITNILETLPKINLDLTKILKSFRL